MEIGRLVLVRGFRGGLASVDREEVRADERRWVRVWMHNYPRETRWVPKDETEPFQITIPEELAQQLAALRPKD